MEAGGASSCSLFLLPPAPSSPSFLHLKTAYGPAFSHVLSDLSVTAGKEKSAQILIIALSNAKLLAQSSPRANTFGTIQALYAGLYKLVCVIAAQQSIELDTPHGIDCRIVFVDVTDATRQGSQAAARHPALQGPIIDMPTLISSGRTYESVYVVESEEGEAFFRFFSNLAHARTSRRTLARVNRVPGGVTAKSSFEAISASKSTSNAKAHYSVAVGGTFDHLHIGHKLLLTATALLMDPDEPEDASKERLLTIGITGDELLVNKKFAEVMESWEERQTKTALFLESIMIFTAPGEMTRDVEQVTNPGPNGKSVRVRFGSGLSINYVQISDPFGPTITDEHISALAISKETRAGGKAVNDKREGKGWAALDVFEVDVLDAEEENEQKPVAEDNFQAKLSSTELRRQQYARIKGNL